MSIPEFVRIGDFGLDLGLAGVKTQERRHAVDHVGESQAGAHDIGRVVLDLTVADPALGLAYAVGLDEFLEEGGDLFAGGTVAGRPEGQEGSAGAGGELEVGEELLMVADAGTVLVQMLGQVVVVRNCSKESRTVHRLGSWLRGG